MKRNRRSVKSLWQFILPFPLVLCLSTCDELPTEPDLAEEPLSSTFVEEPQIYINLTSRVIRLRLSQGDRVFARPQGVLDPRAYSDPRQRLDPESRTLQPRGTADTGQSLPLAEAHPNNIDFEDLIAFIGGRPSLWMELENNVWLIVVYENEPVPTPAGVYVTVTG